MHSFCRKNKTSIAIYLEFEDDLRKGWMQEYTRNLKKVVQCIYVQLWYIRGSHQYGSLIYHLLAADTDYAQLKLGIIETYVQFASAPFSIRVLMGNMFLFPDKSEFLHQLMRCHIQVNTNDVKERNGDAHNHIRV